MKILKFEKFLNESSNFINEAISKGDSYLIGDSTSILLSMTNELRNKVLPLEGLCDPGIDTYGMSLLLEDYPYKHPETKYIFLFIGANDLYEVNSKTIKYSGLVRKELNRIFPNSEKFVVRAGAWGWGKLSIYGEKMSIPYEMNEYYEKIWASLGFKILDEYLEIQFNEEGDPVHPDLSSENIKPLAREIFDISKGDKRFYQEEIKSLRDIKSLKVEDEKILINYYDVLQKAVHDRLVISKKSGFDPVVERVQIGLSFLGYPLPKFGIDGIFEKDTKISLNYYKKDYAVEGNPGEMDDYFFISFINTLKSKKLTGTDIRNILEESFKSIESSGEEYVKKESPYSYSPIRSSSGGNDEYLIFVQHNQGVAGATSLVNAKYGKGKINPFTRSKGMLSNIPGDMPEYKSQIIEALGSGNEQRAASLFLEMWKAKYEAKKNEGMRLINNPKYSSIKQILEKTSADSGIPFDILVAIGNIESGLNPNSGNSTYRGLFALNPATAVKYNPSLNYETVYDPVINSDAAAKMLATGRDSLAKNLAKSGVIDDINFA